MAMFDGLFDIGEKLERFLSGHYEKGSHWLLLFIITAILVILLAVIIIFVIKGISAQ